MDLLKGEIFNTWPMVNLLDILKETEYIRNKEIEALKFVKSDWSDSEILEAVKHSKLESILQIQIIKLCDVLGIDAQVSQEPEDIKLE
ncbi:MAG: hypothetical protein HC831_01725 [Chloroflexia bacterium]|nr:hypothetical protein [Chloroflexia bacterium]